jgi:hypothetical protein
VLQRVHGVLGAAEPLGDLGRAEPHDEAQHHHLALVARQRVERGAQVAPALAADVGERLLGAADLLERDRAARPHVVDRGVVRDAQDPRRERHGRRLVALQRGQELGEDLLRDVLGVVLVADDRADVAVDIVGVVEVQVAHGVAVAGLRAPHGAERQRVALE